MILGSLQKTGVKSAVASYISRNYFFNFQEIVKVVSQPPNAFKKGSTFNFSGPIFTAI